MLTPPISGFFQVSDHPTSALCSWRWITGRRHEISLGNLCPGPLTAPTSLAGRSAVTVILVEDGVGAVEALLLKPRRVACPQTATTPPKLLYSLYSPVDSPRRSARPPLWGRGEGYNYRRPRAITSGIGSIRVGAVRVHGWALVPACARRAASFRVENVLAAGNSRSTRRRLRQNA